MLYAYFPKNHYKKRWQINQFLSVTQSMNGVDLNKSLSVTWLSDLHWLSGAGYKHQFFRHFCLDRAVISGIRIYSFKYWILFGSKFIHGQHLRQYTQNTEKMDDDSL